MANETFRDELLAQINGVRITKRDMLRVVKACAKVPRQRGSLEASVGVIATLFPRTSGKREALYWRMMSLAVVMEDGDMKGWASPPDADGGVLAHEAIFAAAATEPVVVLERPGVGEQFGFDRASLFRRALELRDVAGEA